MLAAHVRLACSSGHASTRSEQPCGAAGPSTPSDALPSAIALQLLTRHDLTPTLPPPHFSCDHASTRSEQPCGAAGASTPSDACAPVALCAPFATSHLPWLTPMLQQRHGLTWSQAHAMVPQRDLPSPPTLPWSQTYRPPFLSHKYCTRHARHHIPNSIALHAHRSHFTLRSQRRRQRVAHRLACARSASADLRWTEELLELGARASCFTGHDQRRQTDACELYLFV